MLQSVVGDLVTEEPPRQCMTTYHQALLSVVRVLISCGVDDKGAES